MTIIPMKFMLKFDPPTITLAYKNNLKEKKIRLYQVYLHGAINKNSAEEIAEQLVHEHPLYLNANVVPLKQVNRLCERLLMSYRNKQQSIRLSQSPRKDQTPSPVRRGMNDEDAKAFKRMAQKDQIFSSQVSQPEKQQQFPSLNNQNQGAFTFQKPNEIQQVGNKKASNPIRDTNRQDLAGIEDLNSPPSYLPSGIEQKPSSRKRGGPMDVLRGLAEKNKVENTSPMKSNLDHILNDMENIEDYE